MSIRPGLHVVLLNYTYTQDIADPQALLERYFSLPSWAEGLRQAGLEVSVVQRFHRTERYEYHEIPYYFVADRFDPWLRPQQLPYQVHRQVVALRPVVVHVNGLLFPLQTKLLRLMLPAACAVVAQNHAERPMLGWQSRLQSWGLRGVDGFFFTAREQARGWLERGIIAEADNVFEIMEGATHTQFQPHTFVRNRTARSDDPVFLWVGNLDTNKDPCTVLAGFADLLAEIPGARLHMVYRYADLLSQVKRVLEQTPSLFESVTLLGQRSQQELAQIYTQADYFVLGSHREGSGFALAEALSFGLVPIVTDIPSFRMMTDNGRIGGLWEAGNHQAFVETARHVLQQPYAVQSSATRDFFSERLSWPAIGRQASAIYQTLITRRQTTLQRLAKGARA